MRPLLAPYLLPLDPVMLRTSCDFSEHTLAAINSAKRGPLTIVTVIFALCELTPVRSSVASTVEVSISANVILSISPKNHTLYCACSRLLQDLGDGDNCRNGWTRVSPTTPSLIPNPSALSSTSSSFCRNFLAKLE